MKSKKVRGLSGGAIGHTNLCSGRRWSRASRSQSGHISGIFLRAGTVLCASNPAQFRGACETKTREEVTPRWHLTTFAPFLQEEGPVREVQGTGARHHVSDRERADRDKRLRPGKRVVYRFCSPLHNFVPQGTIIDATASPNKPCSTCRPDFNPVLS